MPEKPIGFTLCFDRSMKTAEMCLWLAGLGTRLSRKEKESILLREERGDFKLWKTGL